MPVMTRARKQNLKVKLLSRIDRYCRRADVSVSRVGNLAVKDGDFVRRLRDGGTCTIDTYHKVMAWLAKAERTLPMD